MTLVEKIMEQVKTLPPSKQVEILDFINFLCLREEEGKKRIKESLQTLGETGAFADIEDSVEWQKQIGKDRPLPGQEELSSQTNSGALSLFWMGLTYPPFQIGRGTCWRRSMGSHSLRSPLQDASRGTSCGSSRKD